MLKGKHLVIEGFDCDREILGSEELCYRVLDQYPDEIEMTKIAEPQILKHLDPGDPEWGISGFVLIAESHIAFHTYPDRGYIALDVFSF